MDLTEAVWALAGAVVLLAVVVRSAMQQRRSRKR